MSHISPFLSIIPKCHIACKKKISLDGEGFFPDFQNKFHEDEEKDKILEEKDELTWKVS